MNASSWSACARIARSAATASDSDVDSRARCTSASTSCASRMLAGVAPHRSRNAAHVASSTATRATRAPTGARFLRRRGLAVAATVSSADRLAASSSTRPNSRRAFAISVCRSRFSRLLRPTSELWRRCIQHFSATVCPAFLSRDHQTAWARVDSTYLCSTSAAAARVDGSTVCRRSRWSGALDSREPAARRTDGDSPTRDGRRVGRIVNAEARGSPDAEVLAEASHTVSVVMTAPARLISPSEPEPPSFSERLARYPRLRFMGRIQACPDAGRAVYVVAPRSSGGCLLRKRRRGLRAQSHRSAGSSERPARVRRKARDGDDRE